MEKKTENLSIISKKEQKEQELGSNLDEKSEDLLDNVIDVFLDEELEDGKVYPASSKKILFSCFFVLITLICVFSFRSFVMLKKNIKNIQIIIPQPFDSMNDFFYYELKNGLKVLHIKTDNDEFKNDIINLSLSIAVGHTTDCQNSPGMAKLLGKIFFEGSKNYEVNEYIKTVAERHEGKLNTIIEKYTTTHQFLVEDTGFEEILEPFIDALKHPLLDKEFIEKLITELNNRENRRYFTNRNLFNYKILKYLGNKKANIFKDTHFLLNNSFNHEILKTQLEKFHQKYFKANLMSLVIISSEKQNYIKKTVEKYFNSISSDKNIKDIVFEETKEKETEIKLFDDEVFKNIYFAYNKIEIPQLALNFVIDIVKGTTKFDPAHFFKILLNSVNKDSFIFDLYKNNLCTEVKTDFTFNDKSKSIYSIIFSLTEDSQTHISLILQKFYLFIHSIKSKEIHELYNKVKHYTKLDFFFNIDNGIIEFTNKLSSSDFQNISKFSKTLLKYPPQQIYVRNNFLSIFDKEKWLKFLDSLSIQKSIITFRSNDFNLDEDTLLKNKEELEREKSKKRLDHINDVGIYRKLKKKFSKNQENKNRILETNNKGDKQIIGKVSLLNQKLKNLITDKKDKRIKNEKDDLKEQSLKLKSKLEENIDNQLADILTDFFDKPIRELVLKDKLNFDNKLSFEKIPYPKGLFKHFNDALKSKSKNSYVTLTFPTDFMTQFEITNNCKPPEFLKVKTLISEEQAFIFDKDDPNYFVSNKSTPIKTQKIIDGAVTNLKYLNPETMPNTFLKKFLKIKTYKKCLYSEFKIDTKTLVLDSDIQSSLVNILHKTYRQTFQNKFITYIEVNNNFIYERLIKDQDLDNKTLFLLEVKLFCHYFTEHIISNYSLYVIQGNRFSCELKNGLFLIKLESFKHYAKKYAELIFKELKNSSKNIFYEQNLFSNVKEYYIDEYAGFKSLNLDKLLKFYLEILFDRTSFDTSTNEKFKKIKKKINSLTIEKLATFSNKIFENTEMSFIYIGDINGEESMKITKNYASQVYRGEINNNKIATREDLINFLYRPPNEETSVFRVENTSTQKEKSAYMSYFYLGGGITKKTELYLKVILHYLKIFLNEIWEGRDKLKIEKTDISIVNYFNHFGFQVYFIGDFIPHLIEYNIEKSFLDFFNYLKSKRINVYKIIGKNILSKMKDSSKNLRTMADNLYDIYTNQCISNDTFSYDVAINDFNSVEIIDLVKDLFFVEGKTKRIVFQIYNGVPTKKTMAYKLKESLTLDGNQYFVYGKQAIGSRFKFFSSFRNGLKKNYFSHYSQ